MSSSLPPKSTSRSTTRRNRLADLQREINQANELNKIDSRAEHTMIASHKDGTRIRRGVVQTEDGRFITDTRDFANDEGTVAEDQRQDPQHEQEEANDDSNSNNDNTTTSTPTKTATAKEAKDLIADSILPTEALSYLGMSLQDTEYKLKKRRGNDDLEPNANELIGDDRHVLLHQKKVNKSKPVLTPNTGEATGTFNSAVPDVGGVYQLSKELVKSKEKRDEQNIKKRGRNVNTTIGVNFANEEFNRRLDRDYKHASKDLRSALERGTAD